MNIEKIQLENWKLFREPIEIEFSEGLNILHGPNEIGKTTLIDSIRTTFFYKHTSQSGKIKSLIPWGSKLSPSATITFHQNGAYYRITKRFITPQRSILEKSVDNKWERIAEGDKADGEVIKLVGGRFPSKGDTKPEFWGLGQTLWMVQGQPFISEDLNEETLSSLQRLIGAAIESNEEKMVLKSLNERFSNIFTGTKKFKKGSEINNLKEKVKELEERIRETERLKIRKEELIMGMDDNEILLQKKKNNLESASKEKDELKEKVNLAHEHRRNREKLEEVVKRISSEYDVFKKQIDDIKEGTKKIEEFESESFKANTEKKRFEGDLEELQKNISVIVEDGNKIGETIEQNLADKRYAAIAHTSVMEELALKEKEDRLEEVNGLEKELQEKQKSFDLLKAPSKKELGKIEERSHQIHDSKTKLDAIGLTISAVAKSDISGEIYLDGKSAGFDLKRGKRDTWGAHQSVKIEIAETGDIEIKSGSEDVREMKANLEDIEIAYEKAVAPFPMKNLDELRKLLHQKEGLEKDIERLKKELKKIAKNGKEALIREIAESKKRIASNWDKVPEDSSFRKYIESKDKTVAKEELSKKINEIEGVIEGFKKEKGKIENELAKRRKEEEEIKIKIREFEKKIHGNSERMKEIEESLDNLQKDGLTIEAREKRLTQISSELDMKMSAVQGYKDEIGEMETEPIRAFGECERRVERLRADIGKLERDFAGMKRELSILLSSLEDTNKMEEELEYLKKSEQRLLTDAHAIELLYDLIYFYRGRAIETLTEPVQKLVTEDLERLLGTKYSNIKFDKGIKPMSVEVYGWKTDASIDVLSFGTQEQLWYLFRLALGRLLSGEERQLVVLDDPLANTDASRLHRALQILEDRAKDLQIIVVTCDADKYNWLPNANFISLER